MAERPSSPAAPVRVGLVGYGLAGSVFHGPLIASTPGLELVAVAARDEGRRRQAAARHPGVRLVDAAEELLADDLGVELVVVGSPNATHAPIADAAVAAGRHVVVDKPFALTAEEGRRVVERARAAGVVVVPFHNRRWDGDFRTVRRLVADGALGRVDRLESRFDRWRPVPRAGWKEQGGPGTGTGLLYDIGSHLVDQALVLLGPVTQVYAELDRRRPGDPTVEDDVFVALTHASGARSHLYASALSAQPGARFRVLGDRAAYVKHGLDPQEAALAAGRVPGDSGWGEEPEAGRGLLGVAGGEGDAAARPVPTEPGAYEQFYAGVAAAVRDGAPPPVDPDDAVAGLVVLAAAYRSAAEGRVVRLAE